ncbi:MAG: type II toxin-antitoxin system RelE/ParE family toxin [Acidobacteria bacterium]|nr:type II toxin-antitoxin system RelE/ParE family toxin [Acidobacteriota bacterium]
MTSDHDQSRAPAAPRNPVVSPGKNRSAIGDRIAADNPSAAVRWVQRLTAAVERASEMPLAGRIVPEYSDRQDIREMLVRTYRVVYRVRPDTLEVLTIFEGHRLFPEEALPGDDG